MVLCINCVFYLHSENYLVRWSSSGLPKDIDRLHNLRAVFTVSVLFLFISLWYPIVLIFFFKAHIFCSHYFVIFQILSPRFSHHSWTNAEISNRGLKDLIYFNYILQIEAVLYPGLEWCSLASGFFAAILFAYLFLKLAGDSHSIVKTAKVFSGLLLP